jgi:hypothetical protein
MQVNPALNRVPPSRSIEPRRFSEIGALIKGDGSNWGKKLKIEHYGLSLLL